jgi:RNA-directed DNA polymerase
MKVGSSEGLRLSGQIILTQPLILCGKTKEEMTKSLPISKGMVWDSYQRVKTNGGGSGIDGETLGSFAKELPRNLYKLWNRLSSGSYFPPAVKTVLIPKKQGGERPLGIPTVGDRIAQGVVKAHLEVILEPKFVASSYGYRPNKSAHEAVERCQENCRQWSWVLDIDIKGFFDNLSHELLMGMLRMHTDEKWVLMYVGRWLKAGVEQSDGSIEGRTKGTPQGGVISPLLANLYLHHAFDTWLPTHFPRVAFERYADDIVIHCRSEVEAQAVQSALKERLADYALELHPTKTKIVFCGGYGRTGDSEHRSFTFLGFSFQPKMLKRPRYGDMSLCFRAVVSQSSKQGVRDAIKATINPRNIYKELVEFSHALNSKVRGWLNYYCKIDKWGLSETLRSADLRIAQWIRNKYRLRSTGAVQKKLDAIYAEQPYLFVHWQFGMRKMI